MIAERPFRARRALAALAGLLLVVALAGCKVDAQVDVTMGENGSGTVQVTLTADADVVKAEPDLPSELRLDDVTSAGWAVDGPAATPEGGLQLVLTHPFASPAEGTALLASLSGPDGPLRSVKLTQLRKGAQIDSTFDGNLHVGDDLSVFADAQVATALGGAPLQQLLADQQLTPAEVLAITVRAKLPGKVQETNGTEADDTSAVTWTADLAGAAATAQGQPMQLRSQVDDLLVKVATHANAAAPWLLAFWAVLFLLVIIPIAILVGRARRRRWGY
jgi:hypothetical protein